MFDLVGLIMEVGDDDRGERLAKNGLTSAQDRKWPRNRFMSVMKRDEKIFFIFE